MSNRQFYSALVFIVALSFGLRVWAAPHGLPDIQIVDETSDLSTALRLVEGQIPERHVRYHRSLIAYIDFAAVGGLFGYSYFTGNIQSLDDFRDLYFSDRWQFTLAARLLVGALTAGAVLFTGLTGRYVSNRVGLLAAGVLAVNGFFTLNSLYAMPDAIVTVFVALHLWLVLRVWKLHRRRDYFIVGASLALVMLSKISASTVAIGFLIAHAAVIWEQTERNPRVFVRKFINLNLILSGIGLAISNVVFNPLAFLNLNDLIYEITRLGSYAYGESYAPQDRPYIMWVQFVQMTEFAWRWMLIPSLLGFAALYVNRKSVPHWIMGAAFAILFFTLVTVATTNYKMFFWMPWIVPMALMAALGFDFILQQAEKYGWRLVGYGVVVTIFALEGGFTLQILNSMRQQDTRQLALAYTQANWTENTRVMAGDPIAYAVPFQRDEASIARAVELTGNELQVWSWWLAETEDARPSPAYDVYGPELQAVIDTTEDAEQVITENAIQYYVEVDFCLGFTMSPDSNSSLDYPPSVPELKQNWKLIQTFSPFGVDTCLSPINDRTGLSSPSVLGQQTRTGPIVRIYEIVPND